MAQSIQALREQRNALAAEVRNVMDNNTGANWKPEHQAIYDAKTADIERVDAEIAREQKVMDLTAENMIKDAGGKVSGESGDPEARALYNKWLRGGDNALTAAEWGHVRNTMSTTTPSEGGYTIDSTVASDLIKGLKAFGGMREAATVFGTATGGPMSWPTMDDTGNVGEIVAENTAAADLDLSFGTVALPVYKYSSKVVTVPFELVQDTSVDLEGTINAALAQRLARIQNTHFTVGTGSSQPRGIVVAAASGKVGATGQTTTVIYDDLVDLEHSIDPAYRNLPGAGFMLHDTTLRALRKIKDSEGRPIFVPGYESGSPGGAPSTLLGRPIIVNQDVAAMAANAKSILFGVLPNYRIRDVMQATLFRFTDSAYTKKGQVGFMAWMRTGGNLLDLSGATVKHYQNSAT